MFMAGRQAMTRAAVRKALKTHLTMNGCLLTLYLMSATMAAVNTRCIWVTIQRDTGAELGHRVIQVHYRHGLPYRTLRHQDPLAPQAPQ